MLNSRTFLTIFLLIFLSGAFSQTAVNSIYEIQGYRQSVEIGSLNFNGIIDEFWHQSPISKFSNWLPSMNNTITPTFPHQTEIPAIPVFTIPPIDFPVPIYINCHRSLHSVHRIYGVSPKPVLGDCISYHYGIYR